MDETSQKDYLTALPPELLHMIISYLFPTHRPDKAFYHVGLYVEDDPPPVNSNRHPLDFLAATSQYLRAETFDWAESFLRQHQDITKYKTTAKRAKKKPRFNWLRDQGGLIWWSERKCVFCGKVSNRTATFMNGLRCCVGCDNAEWPDKITKTAAMHEYHLTGHHLLPHKERTPISAKMLATHPGGLPKLRYGTCMSSNVVATMFLRKDVVALAQLAHGDLKAHLAKRKVEREERARKMNAMMAKKRAELAALAQPGRQTMAATLSVAPVIEIDSGDEDGGELSPLDMEAGTGRFV